MFKKLVVGTLTIGIVLTGGIGATSASTEGVDNTKIQHQLSNVSKYLKMISV